MVTPKKIRIKLVTLGNLKYPLRFQSIQGWRSQVFQAEHAEQQLALPDSQGGDWAYSDEQFRTMLSSDDSYDVTVGIVNVPLEDNYYIRPISDRVCVLTLHETADILRAFDLRVEDFILKNLYTLTCVFHLQKSIGPEKAHDAVHEETRGCLLDLNANKLDIRFSMERPNLCSDCRARLGRSTLPNGFLASLDRELPRIRRPIYYTISDFIKTRTILAALLAVLFGLAMDVLGHYIYHFLTGSK